MQPDAGTIWTQQIITSIYELDDDHVPYPNNLERMPWLEYLEGREDYSLRPSPRLFASHLTPALLPPGLRSKKAKVGTRIKGTPVTALSEKLTLLELYQTMRSFFKNAPG